MPLQMRPREGGISYAPYRDLSHNYPGIVKLALRMLAETEWTVLIGDYLRANNVKEEDFVPVAEAVADYVLNCLKKDVKSPYEALEQAGFLKLPVAVQLAFMAKLGELFTSFFYSCTREAHALNEVQLGLDELMKEAKETGELLARRTREKAAECVEASP